MGSGTFLWLSTMPVCVPLTQRGMWPVHVCCSKTVTQGVGDGCDHAQAWQTRRRSSSICRRDGQVHLPLSPSLSGFRSRCAFPALEKLAGRSVTADGCLAAPWERRCPAHSRQVVKALSLEQGKAGCPSICLVAASSCTAANLYRVADNVHSPDWAGDRTFPRLQVIENCRLGHEAAASLPALAAGSSTAETAPFLVPTMPRSSLLRMPPEPSLSGACNSEISIQPGPAPASRSLPLPWPSCGSACLHLRLERPGSPGWSWSVALTPALGAWRGAGSAAEGRASCFPPSDPRASPFPPPQLPLGMG